ncbi:hypothetical protein PP178_14550 [Zeaxanthinibacter sp. PT1]|uniref:hypothetical protein n=1 Tax=Zeaxanthinibacter TaxID=561554 RepID=UPI002349E9C9|nr:hypothetical protein [Zeaxanthinibacter sp. PT1]MDC6352779.1 hypothetical protein [Zeaxanthinibacter sp. PT1]
MKFFPTRIASLLSITCAIFFIFSCQNDLDLLQEVILNDPTSKAIEDRDKKEKHNNNVESTTDNQLQGNSATPEYHLILDELKSFPSAFGAGKYVEGGRGQEVYEVTNLNDSGPGSFRDALSEGNRIIIIKVEGIVHLKSQLAPSSSDNITIWGQFAPGRGLTISDNRIVIENASNVIMRHMTFQNMKIDGYSAFGFRNLKPGAGIYADHNSFRYGKDQTFDVGMRHSDNRVTASYNIMAETADTGSSGGIFGDSGNGLVNVGALTFARNMSYNLSHRFPNLSGGEMKVEHYNNYIVNWSSRLTRTNGGVMVDWFNNYCDEGNRVKSSSTPINKASYHPNFRTYTANNYVGGINENPSENQKDLWVYYKDNVVAKDNEPILNLHYKNARQHFFNDPSDGIWDVYEVPQRVRASVGHNRGINEDGSPGFFRDDKDADYIYNAASGNTESQYRSSNEWDYSSFTGTNLYKDSDGDHMPDWFENHHQHLDPNLYDSDNVHENWSFGLYDVSNYAGYTNLEMCAEFYAGGFESMIDGINDL